MTAFFTMAISKDGKPTLKLDSTFSIALRCIWRQSPLYLRRNDLNV